MQFWGPYWKISDSTLKFLRPISKNTWKLLLIEKLFSRKKLLWTMEHSFSLPVDRFLQNGKKIFAGFEEVINYEPFKKLDFLQNDPPDTYNAVWKTQQQNLVKMSETSRSVSENGKNKILLYAFFLLKLFRWNIATQQTVSHRCRMKIAITRKKVARFGRKIYVR